MGYLLLRLGCILSKFYIKPQLQRVSYIITRCCILSKFYIKPQQTLKPLYSYWVVSYRNSTSNHNSSFKYDTATKLYLIEILHQTTTRPPLELLFMSCILSKFYIKPQLCPLKTFTIRVVSYRNSTSNHNANWDGNAIPNVVSYRNSTSNHNGGSRYSDWLEVVSYRNSTSNHNRCQSARKRPRVVSYRNSTSNHNRRSTRKHTAGVVSYRNSTSNHNYRGCLYFSSAVVSYRNSTSNHNSSRYNRY